ncbi:MAG: hypothetical protein ACKODJ_10275, partial [Bacteroidota bacterium]
LESINKELHNEFEVTEFNAPEVTTALTVELVEVVSQIIVLATKLQESAFTKSTPLAVPVALITAFLTITL